MRFDLVKNFPKEFDPLTDTLPAEIDALFDKVNRGQGRQRG